ncbi:transcriptional regulator, PadR-like family [Methanococcus vannielii SB]|uniref:Transcriptional regulator, PadR-like family n=1 Tax=Methanococcus vannielii (strain ATCC 35089 / DSM 1224 / JCM 13029 / OCM 148 / SB) TaxID=406327 RepID=A6USJ8_METVS|nr:PadR family transcriptional regulator [Methanococcus vannielii]ABR55470.1 transcriptional regulator, PadR-like family [Methanococcus vannielii SB]
MDPETEISNMESAILGLLIEKPMYGYEIEKKIDERNMRQWTEVAFSSIYYVLKKLEEKKLVESKTTSKNGRTRKIYYSTDLGHLVMKNKVKSLLSNNEKLISGFDLGLSNLWMLSREEAIETFEKYIISVENSISTFNDVKKRIESENLPNYILELPKRSLMHLNLEKEFAIEFKKKLEYDNKLM